MAEGAPPVTIVLSEKRAGLLGLDQAIQVVQEVFGSAEIGRFNTAVACTLLKGPIQR